MDRPAAPDRTIDKIIEAPRPRATMKPLRTLRGRGQGPRDESADLNDGRGLKGRRLSSLERWPVQHSTVGI